MQTFEEILVQITGVIIVIDTTESVQIAMLLVLLVVNCLLLKQQETQFVDENTQTRRRMYECVDIVL